LNNREGQNHLFWGDSAPLSTLIGAGLLIMASSRTAFALVTLGALVWVYGLTVLILRLAAPVFPQKGTKLTQVCLCGFLGGLYFFILCLVSPLLAIEITLVIILVPVCCITAEVINRTEKAGLKEALIRSCSEAAILGTLILALALIRESLGFGSLSLPGGPRGIIEISVIKDNSLFPIQIIGASSGALLLMGYGVAFFHQEKKRQYPASSDPSGKGEPLPLRGSSPYESRVLEDTTEHTEETL
jgi:hypothetical protein